MRICGLVIVLLITAVLATGCLQLLEAYGDSRSQRTKSPPPQQKSFGQKEQSCVLCNGTGEKTCSICNGSGVAGDCYSCNGTGRERMAGKLTGRSCFDCRGKGYRKCLSCRNGYKKCYSCQGRGYTK